MREQPTYRSLMKEIVDTEVILKIVADIMGVSKTQLSIRLTDGVGRGIAAELLYRHS